MCSYERSYKNLLDRMIKYDFSLKGNFGGFELLIFSSNLLPEKSQRESLIVTFHMHPCKQNEICFFIVGLSLTKFEHCRLEQHAVFMGCI